MVMVPAFGRAVLMARIFAKCDQRPRPRRQQRMRLVVVVMMVMAMPMPVRMAVRVVVAVVVQRRPGQAMLAAEGFIAA